MPVIIKKQPLPPKPVIHATIEDDYVVPTKPEITIVPMSDLVPPKVPLDQIDPETGMPAFLVRRLWIKSDAGHVSQRV